MSVAAPVPTFLAGTRTRFATRCHPAFGVPAPGANEDAPRPVLHVGIDAAVLGTGLPGAEPGIAFQSGCHANRPSTRKTSPTGTCGVGDAQGQVRLAHDASDIERSNLMIPAVAVSRREIRRRMSFLDVANLAVDGVDGGSLRLTSGRPLLPSAHLALRTAKPLDCLAKPARRRAWRGSDDRDERVCALPTVATPRAPRRPQEPP